MRTKYSCHSNVCGKCCEEYHMPYPICCLYECGEHEFCAGCSHGIYSEEYRDWLEKEEKSK